MSLLQQILTYSYIFLGFAAFWYLINTILSFLKLLQNRKPEQSILKVMLKLFNDEMLTQYGIFYKKTCTNDLVKLVFAIIGMILIVNIGIQTQS